MRTIWIVGYWSYQTEPVDPAENHELYWLNRKLATFRTEAPAKAWAAGWKACLRDLEAVGVLTDIDEVDEYLDVREVDAELWQIWWEQEIQYQNRYAKEAS